MIDIIDEQNSSPRFKLDLRKFMYLQNTVETSVSHKKSASLVSSIKPLYFVNQELKTDKNFERLGTLHFHNQTLRHDSGKFSLNIIYSTPKNSFADAEQKKFKIISSATESLGKASLKTLEIKTRKAISTKRNVEKYSNKKYSQNQMNTMRSKLTRYLKNHY